MKTYLVIPAIALMAVAGCTRLGEEDRALINSANQAAQEAKEQSMRAADEARRAREDADRAATAAQMASEKADRIFRQGQNK